MGDCKYLGGSYYNGGMATSGATDLGGFPIGDNFALIDPFAQGGFQGANDDLNSFFTPGLDGSNKSKVFPNPIKSSQMEGQWEIGDGSHLFAGQQGFPFPIVQPQPHSQQYINPNFTMDASDVASQYNAPAEVQPLAPIMEEQPKSPIEPVKPKRGRPRKRKGKVPLSEDERQRKREAFLDRNRRAASKCRKRKKEMTENIQSRATLLDKKSRVLTAELMLMRAEHARWLNLAIEHAKSCAADPNCQEYLEAAETRLAELSNFAPLGRIEEWDKNLSEATRDEEGTTVSHSISPRDTSNLQALELGCFDFAQYGTNRQLDQEAQLQATGERLEPAEMEREDSASTVSTEVSSAKDSAYYSASNNPLDSIQHGSPVSETFREEQRPMMLPNLRYSRRAAASTLEQPTPRQLRSSTSAGGPIDLDHPFAYLRQQSRS